MVSFEKSGIVRLGVIVWILGMILPGQAVAYVDPGTTGMLSQVLYVLFYGAVAVLFYCLRYIKIYIDSLKKIVAKYFGRKT